MWVKRRRAPLVNPGFADNIIKAPLVNLDDCKKQRGAALKGVMLLPETCKRIYSVNKCVHYYHGNVNGQVAMLEWISYLNTILIR